MVTLPADAFNSESESQTETNSFDDRRRGYPMPFPRSDPLRVFRHADNTFACPVCPGMRHQWKILNEVKDHVVGMATSVPLRCKNKKKWSRQLVVAWNEGWLG
ncbi:hypothetical protein SETIT_3G253000v2 [Setaria italica]|uniref:Uncharacterized protein n=1 Tax=Setaria italica TaxID=4555 RepID=A0A368QIT5_SETIT|nr:hypothetical protein SETIT_3G253000v2 [Setaria italica]